MKSHRFYYDTKNFPPGPPRFPVVGSILSVNRNSFGHMIMKDATALIPKYGKIMGYLAFTYRK